MKRDYPLYIWRNNNSNGMGGFNVLDNIVAFYIFFTVVGFLAAMLGTIIGAGGGLVFVPLFMYWFPEWSPSMVVGTSLFSVMCNAISGSIAYLKQKKVYINAAIIFSLATFPGAILGAQMSGWFSGKGFMFAFGCFMLCASVLIGFKNFRKGERKEESLTLEQLSYSKPIGISISFFCWLYFEYLWYRWWPHPCAGFDLSHGLSYPYGNGYKSIYSRRINNGGGYYTFN